MSDPYAVLRDLFDAMVARADPMTALPGMLPDRPRRRVVVLGAGKASARMAEALEAAWGPCEGLVITRYGYSRPTQGVEIAEASHPTPDAAGVAASRRMLELAQSLGPEDTAICLISGGASALMTLPPDGLDLEDMQALSSGLLKGGAPIDKTNVVRRHVCQIKGGRLAAAAHPAKVISLIMSDVPGDDLAFVGSGSTVGHGSTSQDALDILDHYLDSVPPKVAAFLDQDQSHVDPDHPALTTVDNILFVSPAQALAHVHDRALAMGLTITDLGADVEGEAREVAQTHATLARHIQADPAAQKPHLILSGGELTVTARGGGVGGPNAEYALALAMALDGQNGIHAMACDTDGVDGAAEVAGAYVHPETLAQAADKGLSPQAALDTNDAHSFFAAIGDQVVTGPTLTNVNDYRAILVT